MTQNNNGASVKPPGGEAFSGHSLHVFHWSKMPQSLETWTQSLPERGFTVFLSNCIWEYEERTLREHRVSISRTERL